jgi:hypothetical protein
MKKGLTILFIFACFSHIHCQDLSNFRVRTIISPVDSLPLDTLSIVPGTFCILDEKGSLISDSLYRVDYGHAYIRIAPVLQNRTLTVTYRIFPIKLTDEYSHRKPAQVMQKNRQTADPFRLTGDDLRFEGFYSQSDLNKRGSLSRGIVFGNNQDVVVNSNLNLQLSGKLTEDLNLVAAISDNNIPIQPDGYSQQIHEFDKVYITLYNEKMTLTAGDFDQSGSPGTFMKFSRKGKGATFTGDVLPDKNNVKLKTTITGAVAKGKFSRNQFMGIESTQGPYKLRGGENEQFIIVLAGSERVYIDGVLMKRGLENDYVIDYNTAEISFTPNQLITKNKRIIVEFEYSERSYARFLVYNSNEFTSGRGKHFLNIYSESDDRNQTLQQDLNEQEKEMLASVGDRIEEAMVLRVDSISFRDSEILYRKTDSTVNGLFFSPVYIYSTNPDSAFFRLGFSFVGTGNGNYEPVRSAANGKVYRWLAPVSGTPQGSYEPVVLLITPKKKQLITAGGEQTVARNTRFFYELAVSNNDLNTFSAADANDNIGYAAKTGIDQLFLSRDTTRFRLHAGAVYQFINKNFDAVDRFRPVEFERDWNLSGDNSNTGEHMLSLHADIFRKDQADLSYTCDLLSRGSVYDASRNKLKGMLTLAGFTLILDGSFMQSSDLLNTTNFLRHNLTLSRKIRNKMVLGMGEAAENNAWWLTGNDSLLGNNFRFNEYEAFIMNGDSSKNEYRLSFKHRQDYLPLNNRMDLASRSDDVKASLNILSLPGNLLKTVFTYRHLEFTSDIAGRDKPENTLVTRLEHSMQLLKNTCNASTFYEIGSGLESRKEYAYLEVAPGQGIYTWTDYNHNQVKELDEFEISRFKDLSSYIRIFIPTDDYIKVYTSQFNHTLNLDLSRLLGDRNGFTQILSRFSDQFAYRLDRKSIAHDFLMNANPFYADLNNPELVTITTSLRNNLSFNRTGKSFSVDYLYLQNRNRLLLANGFDTRNNSSNGLRVRYSVTAEITFINQSDAGTKIFTSEFFPTKDYDIRFRSNDIRVQYQPGIRSRFVLNYLIAERKNLPDTEKALENTFGAEFRFGIADKCNLSCKADYIHIDYTAESDTPLSYEMLQGMQAGRNAVWSLLLQKNLSGGIELNIEYSGRASASGKVIHAGGVQVRAAF